MITGLVVFGRKDKRPRRVEHITNDMKSRQQSFVRDINGVKHTFYRMFYWGPHGREIRIINKARLEKVTAS